MMNEQIVRKWYTYTLSILSLLLLIYVLLHVQMPGAEIIKISKQEISDVNLILFGTVTSSVKPESTVPPKPSVAKLEPANKDSVPSPSVPDAGLDESKVSDSIRKATVFNYIFSVRKPLCEQDSLSFRNYFENFNKTQFSVVIPNYPIRVKSYFWLTEGNRKSSVNSCNIQEGSVYLEIIFWTWFGLIASLLYNVSEALRTTEFKINEVGVHIAKFFYSPLISLVIYFSINSLISDGSISLAEFSHGTIVLAFILGFFSGRAIELLTRVKDLILPLNADKKEPSRPNSSASGSDEESELVIDEATAEHKSVIG